MQGKLDFNRPLSLDMGFWIGHGSPVSPLFLIQGTEVMDTKGNFLPCPSSCFELYVLWVSGKKQKWIPWCLPVFINCTCGKWLSSSHTWVMSKGLAFLCKSTMKRARSFLCLPWRALDPHSNLVRSCNQSKYRINKETCWQSNAASFGAAQS